MENGDTITRNVVYQWIRNVRLILEEHLSMIDKSKKINKDIEENGESEEIDYWSIYMALERPFNELDNALSDMKDIVAYLTNNDEPRLTEYFVYRRGVCIRIQDYLSKGILSIKDKKYSQLIDSLLKEIESVDMFLTEIAHPEIQKERENRFLEELEQDTMSMKKKQQNASENEDPETRIEKTIPIFKGWKAVESKKNVEHIFENIELDQYLEMVRTADFSAIKMKQVNPVVYTMYRISKTMGEEWLRRAVERWNKVNKDYNHRDPIDYKRASTMSNFKAKKHVFPNDTDKGN